MLTRGAGNLMAGKLSRRGSQEVGGIKGRDLRVKIGKRKKQGAE